MEIIIQDINKAKEVIEIIKVAMIQGIINSTNPTIRIDTRTDKVKVTATATTKTINTNDFVLYSNFSFLYIKE